MTAAATSRLSISLPTVLQQDFDRMLADRGFENRSQALAELIRGAIAEHRMEQDDEVMAGTITLFYDESKPQLPQRIATLQREHLPEVISSQHILLEDNHRMEILVVQGPVKTLREILNRFLAIKGVKTSQLQLTPMLLPPLHPRRPSTSRRSKKD